MDKSYYQQYEPVFGSWYIKELLGEGSFGQVYRIERNEMGITYDAALKAITIPQSQNEVRSIMADGMTKAEITTYYKGIVQDLISEIVLMSKLKGNSNIVSYEDHVLKEHEDHVGWDILIRMELLTPLYDYVLQNKMTKREIIKLGIDICKALELCQKYNIIHRDVKPENIFVSQTGDFKLGDFGIARMVEKTSSGLSKKGTYTYMAPEIYRGDQYGSTVDLYSLGIVMYRLLNNNRTPFLPPYPQPITHNDKEGALLKRISGKELPTPVNATGRLAEIVLKACAFEPSQRYTSAMQMRMELEAILYDKDEAELMYPDGELSSMGSECYATETQTAVEEVLVRANEPTAYMSTAILEDFGDDEKTESIFEEIIHDESVPNEKTESLWETMIIDEREDIGYALDSEDFIDDPKEKNVETDYEKIKVDKFDTSEKNCETKVECQNSKTISAVKSKSFEKKYLPFLIAGIIIIIMAIVLLNSKNVTDIEGFDTSVTLNHGESIEFNPIAVAKDGLDYEVTYEIEDEDIAYVKDDKIYGKSVGKTIMTLSADDYTEDVEIVVEKAEVKKIKGVSKEVTLYIGDTYRLSPVIEPEEASESTKITFKTNKNNVATVSSEGKVKAKSEGTAIITITAGDVKKEVIIHVIEEPVYQEETIEEAIYDEPEVQEEDDDIIVQEIEPEDDSMEGTDIELEPEPADDDLAPDPEINVEEFEPWEERK